jgi:hypothetical protein
MTSAAGDIFNTPYAPDFDSPDRSTSYALRSGARLCQFDLRITDLVKAGENVLVIENATLPQIKRTLVVDAGRIELRAPFQPRPKRPAPTGPLVVIQPARRCKVDYLLTQQPDAAMQLTLDRELFRVESEFSTPQPAWVKGTNRYFRHDRRVEQRDEAIIVHDTFINLTDQNLPLMHRHRVMTAQPLKKVWLAGLSPVVLKSSSSSPANPTTFGATTRSGVGVLPLDDVSQVHVLNFSAPDHVGWADNHCVLRPGARHTVRWAIIPTYRPDYYAFLNALRRLRDVNFTIPGSYAFLRAHPQTITDKWSDREFADFIRFKNAYFVCDSYMYPTYKGRFPHGTAFQTLDFSGYFKRQMARLRRLVPEAKHILYFHCFIDVLDEAPEKYRDARLLLSSGTQADYGLPHDRIFVPTQENTFGRDITRNVDLILAPLPGGFGCDGVYWDEFEYSRFQYTYDDYAKGGGLPWDGVSGDIDPRSMKLTRLKSSVTLISQPFRLALTKRILEKHLLVANGQPHTETMVKLHFPRFVETGSISHCADAQVYSPIALGDHLTEQSETDAYRVMLRALDFGCVYYWYNDVTVVPTHPHLTSYMFPITPLELHEGYIIGRERIVTNRSGLYGWGDASKHEVHVFDDQGRELPHFKAAQVIREGATFTELRLPEDFSAAILRK